MSIKLIIFDADGTLFDNKNEILYSLNKIISRLKPSYNSALLTRQIGDTKLSVTLSEIGLGKEQIEQVHLDFKREVASIAKNAKLCPGVYNLKEIKQNKIIVSNAPLELISGILKEKKIDFIKEVHSSEEEKSKIIYIKKLLKSKKIHPIEAIYVGDKAIDASVARGIGCKGVVVSNKCSWSKRSEIIKKQPDFIIESLEDLPSIIKNLN